VTALVQNKAGAPSGEQRTATASPWRSQVQGLLRHTLQLLLTCVALLVLWQLLISVWRPSTVVLPSPRLVGIELKEEMSLFAKNAVPTLVEAAGGFVIAVILGVPLGTLLSRPYRICRAFEPLMLITQVFPKIAVAPLFIVWFGFGLTPKFLFVLLLTFFPITLNTIDGYRSLPKDLRDLGVVMGMSPMQRLRSIEFPHALPQILTGMKVSASFGITAAIVYEFIGSNTGLGYIVGTAQANLATPLMFAALIWVAVLGFAFYGLIALLERIAIPWHISQRGG
jgi:NitT/TauT family transport system permease protein